MHRLIVGVPLILTLFYHPRYNYPTFLNLYSNFMYIPISFLYILPVSYFGWFHGAIPRAHLISIPKAPFAVMGALDALAASMQILSSVYLPGTLLVLLPQAAIPLSMLFSRAILHEKFTKWQYIGAAIVFGGILVVLSPVLLQKHVPEYSCQALNLDQDCAICQVETNEEDCLAHLTFDKQSAITFITDGEDTNNSGQTVDCQWVSKDTSLRHDDFLVVVWSLIMVASCVPMVLSSVYKQMALQLPNLDPILVNGWVALFQFLFGIPLAIPAGLVSSPPVSPFGLFHNWKDGFRCLFQQMNAIDYGCHPDHCSQAVLWVHLGLLSAVVYTVSLLFVLKFGGASVLYVGLTVMVPLGHLVFALHSPSSIVLENVIGLAVLLTGLIMYRFGTTELLQDLNNRSSQEGGGGVAGEEDNNQGDDGSKSSYWEFLREPFMLSGDV
jgi:drug/metabolite transporter (DMT)-like permease